MYTITIVNIGGLGRTDPDLRPFKVALCFPFRVHVYVLFVNFGLIFLGSGFLHMGNI